MTTIEIINAINSFDYDYKMSDSHDTWRRYSSIDCQISNAIKQVTPEQAVEIYNSISSDWRKDENHGKMLAAMLPAPQPTEPQQTKVSKSIDRKSIFTTAWELFKGGLFASFGQALKAAWSKVKVLTGLKSGTVVFQYLKDDGSIRTAKGTLSGLDYQSKGESKPNNKIVKYFDIEANGFRSFRIDRFLGQVA
jgi:hypothetical protein